MKRRDTNERSTSIKSVSLFWTALFLSTGVAAVDEKLECDLYVQSGMGEDTGSSINVDRAGVLESERLSGICLFTDGSLADKQFVNISLSAADGSSGSNSGFSIYTVASGDALYTRYSGEWGSNGFTGIYEITGGSGKYEDAKGDGSFTGAKSPWKNQGKFKVELNIATP